MFALRFIPMRAIGALALSWLLAAAGLGALASLGGCATSQGALGEQDLRTASDDSDARKRARNRLALSANYYQDGKYTIALDEMKKAIQLDPAFSEPYALGGLIYMALNNLPQAQAYNEKALSLNPRDAGAMHNMGMLKCRQKDYGAATAWFQRAIAEPEYPSTGKAKSWLMQGACEISSGDRAKAEQSLMHSFQLDPGNPATEYNLAKLLLERGDLEHAQFYIRRLNNTDRANAESLWLGIKVERRLKNTQAVDQLALQLRRRFPESSQLISYERGAFDD